LASPRQRVDVTVGCSAVINPVSLASFLTGNDAATLGTIVDMNAGASRLVSSRRRQGGLQALTQ
jgi:hypothetical protein